MRGGAKLGVLPLTLVGTDETEAHLALGLAEEITSALARFRWLFLVSSSSIAQFVPIARDDAALRRTLGLDYILDGSVQRVGKRLRITVRLVDLQDGSQIVWARRFDRQVDDLLTLQDEVAAEVVAQIDPEILLIESRRAAHRPPQHATAYDLVLRAIPGPEPARTNQLHAGRRPAAPGHRAGAGIRVGPCALCVLAALPGAGRLGGRRRIRPRRRPRSTPNAPSRWTRRTRKWLHHRRACAGGTCTSGCVKPSRLHDRALALNPNLAMAWALSGIQRISASAISTRPSADSKRYKQLSPMDPGAFHYDIGLLHRSP